MSRPLEANGIFSVTVGKTNWTVVTQNFTVDCSYERWEFFNTSGKGGERDCSACGGANATFIVPIEKMTCDKTKFVVSVKDKATKRAIQNANITIEQGDKYIPAGVPGQLTDDKGEISIIGMPKGDFDITISAEHYD